MSYFANSDQLPDWVRHVPNSWKNDWLKWHVSLSTERPDEEQRAMLPYLSNEDIASWTGKLLREELEPYEADSRLFQAGDVLFNKLRPYLAKVFHANFDGASSGELLCLRPSEDVDARYLFYVLTSFGFIDAVNSHTFGSKMPRADWETVGHQPLPLPRIEAQQRITRFLDEKTAQIDALIEKKRALLDRLAEKRQALITRAVTKGLNPDAPMKPSGIDWLGDIPAHWEIRALKRHIQRIEQGWSPQTEGRTATPDEWGVLKSGCVNLGIFNENEHKALPPHLDARPELEVRAGDILMCRASGSMQYIGSVALVEHARKKLMFSDKTYRITIDHSATDSRYFVFTMLAKHLREQIRLSVSGAEGLANNIPQASVYEYLHVFPPLLEQKKIAVFVLEKISELDAAQGKIGESIKVLNAYRSSMITAVVTGQLPELNG